MLRLFKVLYGLRQAPRASNAKLETTLVSLGLQRSPSEHVVYMCCDGDERLLLGVYIDDLIVTGSSAIAITHFE